MKKFLSAWNFLTCLSLFPKTKIAPQDLSRSMAFFPIVGLLIALVPAIFIFALYSFLSPFLGSVITILIFSVITGGLHLDGLADTVDGISGGKDKKEILAIMRDSHTGAMGVMAIIFIVSLKIALVNEIWLRGDRFNLLKAIFLFPVLSRWAMVGAAWLLPYARNGEGVGKIFAKEVMVREWLISTLFVVFITSFILKLCAILFLPLIFLTSLFFINYFKRKIGGVTGDVFGAINELMEVFSLGYIVFI